MIQLLAAGLELLRGKQTFALRRARIAGLWRQGSVVRNVVGGQAVRKAEGGE